MLKKKKIFFNISFVNYKSALNCHYFNINLLKKKINLNLYRYRYPFYFIISNFFVNLNIFYIFRQKFCKFSKRYFLIKLLFSFLRAYIKNINIFDRIKNKYFKRYRYNNNKKIIKDNLLLQHKLSFIFNKNLTFSVKRFKNLHIQQFRRKIQFLKKEIRICTRFFYSYLYLKYKNLNYIKYFDFKYNFYLKKMLYMLVLNQFIIKRYKHCFIFINKGIPFTNTIKKFNFLSFNKFYLLFNNDLSLYKKLNFFLFKIPFLQTKKFNINKNLSSYKQFFIYIKYAIYCNKKKMGVRFLKIK